MSGKEVYELGVAPVSCYSFNKDRSQLAFSPNSNVVHIYKKVGKKWEPDCTLNEHSQRVTSVDWAPETNKIVTCGSDRNAYVWTLKDGKWKPTLVILRINRAATFVRFSPLENKFAVGSGARLVAVCYFEKENDWWVSKHIKKPIRSTVLCVDWHPNNYLIAAGSSDFKARVFSGYIKEVESKPSENIWGKKMPIGQLLQEFSSGGRGGWVHSVSFSPSGDKLAWCAHDSTVNVASANNKFAVVTITSHLLPLLSLTWITENSIVAAGHDYVPTLFTHDDKNQLTFIQKLDVPKKKEGGGQMSAMAKFRTMDKHAQSSDETDAGAVTTTHQNAINCVRVYEGTKADCIKFSTSGLDGRIVLWDVKSLESSIAGLKIQ